MTNKLKVISNINPAQTYSDKEYTELEEEMMEWRSDCHKYRKRWIKSQKFIFMSIIFAVIGLLV